jgi:hypothetical protein
VLLSWGALPILVGVLTEFLFPRRSYPIYKVSFPQYFTVEEMKARATAIRADPTASEADKTEWGAILEKINGIANAKPPNQDVVPEPLSDSEFFDLVRHTIRTYHSKTVPFSDNDKNEWLKWFDQSVPSFGRSTLNSSILQLASIKNEEKPYIQAGCQILVQKLPEIRTLSHSAALEPHSTSRFAWQRRWSRSGRVVRLLRQSPSYHHP